MNRSNSKTIESVFTHGKPQSSEHAQERDALRDAFRVAEAAITKFLPAGWHKDETLEYLDEAAASAGRGIHYKYNPEADAEAMADECEPEAENQESLAKPQA